MSASKRVSKKDKKLAQQHGPGYYHSLCKPSDLAAAHDVLALFVKELCMAGGKDVSDKDEKSKSMTKTEQGKFMHQAIFGDGVEQSSNEHGAAMLMCNGGPAGMNTPPRLRHFFDADYVKANEVLRLTPGLTTRDFHHTVWNYIALCIYKPTLTKQTHNNTQYIAPYKFHLYHEELVERRCDL